MKNRIWIVIAVISVCSLTCSALAGRSTAQLEGGALAPDAGRAGVATFSAEMDPLWRLYTDGIGSLLVTEDGARVTLIDPGTNAQLYRAGMLLEGDTEYKLSFEAQSSRGQAVRVAVRKHGAPYDSYGLSQRVDLTTMESEYELVFTTTPGDKDDARLQFYFTPFDEAGDWYRFDEVEIEKVEDEGDDDDDEGEFEEADLYFELNDTDGDLGIHGSIDGGAWTELTIETPDETENLEIELDGSMAAQGLTQLFFESAEPTFDELDPAEFFARFPEGEYTIGGKSLDGEELENTDELVHLLPAPPNVRVNGVPLPEDCDVDPLPTISRPLTIAWDPVTLSHPEIGRTNEPIELAHYELVVEGEDPEFKFSFIVPADVTEVTLPEGLVGEGEVKVEVLVREESGNQTAAESCIEVE